MNNYVPSRRVLHALAQRSYAHAISLHCPRRTIAHCQQRKRKDETELIDVNSLRQAAESKRDEDAQIKTGRLGPSIFDQAEQDEAPESTTKQSRKKTDGRQAPTFLNTNWRQLRPSVKDPRPRARIRWQRKKVIRDVQGRHRLTAKEKILRTERYHTAKSPFIKTSVKKLFPLARQIAGKPVEEALLQMRFSKKKAAKDVMKHLKYTRDQAVLAKGMGLGGDIAPGVSKPQKQDGAGQGANEQVEIRDRDGKRRTITDPNAMYVDQAWVGRGPFGFGMDYRARGRGNRLRLPYTSLSLVLKEEATRIREHKEKEEKKAKRKPWVQLPDRPITAQRQYPMW